MGELAAGIAHEIKTPAQYVGDNVRFLQETFADVMQLLEQYRAHVLRESPQLTAALEGLEQQFDLQYLRIEVPRAIEQSLDGLARISAIVLAIKELSHPDRDRSSTVDINRLVSTAATVCSSEWRIVADLKLELTPNLPAIECCPGPISQVLINLIVNAAHAIAARSNEGVPTKGQITLETRAAQDGVELRVRDTGGGIPAAVRPRIFEQHFTTKPAGQGTGQGLSMAKQIIEKRHRGRIWFETTENVGTMFVIWLPLKPAAAAI